MALLCPKLLRDLLKDAPKVPRPAMAAKRPSKVEVTRPIDDNSDGGGGGGEQPLAAGDRPLQK